MGKKQHRYVYTGTGIALGATLGVFLWALTGHLVFMALGASLGLIMGAIGDGFGDQ